MGREVGGHDQKSGRIGSVPSQLGGRVADPLVHAVAALVLLGDLDDRAADAHVEIGEARRAAAVARLHDRPPGFGRTRHHLVVVGRPERDVVDALVPGVEELLVDARPVTVGLYELDLQVAGVRPHDREHRVGTLTVEVGADELGLAQREPRADARADPLLDRMIEVADDVAVLAYHARKDALRCAHRHPQDDF